VIVSILKKSLLTNFFKKRLLTNFFKKSLIKNANLLRKGLIEKPLETARSTGATVVFDQKQRNIWI
jgi:hypothetical protein